MWPTLDVVELQAALHTVLLDVASSEERVRVVGDMLQDYADTVLQQHPRSTSVMQCFKTCSWMLALGAPWDAASTAALRAHLAKAEARVQAAMDEWVCRCDTVCTCAQHKITDVSVLFKLLHTQLP